MFLRLHRNDNIWKVGSPVRGEEQSKWYLYFFIKLSVVDKVISLGSPSKHKYCLQCSVNIFCGISGTHFLYVMIAQDQRYKCTVICEYKITLMGHFIFNTSDRVNWFCWTSTVGRCLPQSIMSSYLLFVVSFKGTVLVSCALK